MREVDVSERNYSLFCEVEFRGLTLRDAARKYEISVARVQQILAQTRAWYRATTKEWVREEDDQWQPHVACRFMEERLEYLYSQAMNSWECSMGAKSVTRKGGSDQSETVTTRYHYGDVKYLQQAVRLTLARYDARVRSIAAMRVVPPASDAAPVEEASPVEPTTPPTEGCAPETPLPEAMRQALDSEPTLSTFDADSCVNASSEQPHENAAVVDFVNPVRARKQRKRRQRELERRRA